MELRSQIKETILVERTRKLNESFDVLSDIRDDDYIIETYLKVCSGLLQEGYTIDEIESVDLKDKIGGLDMSSMMKSGMLSAGKEYAIRFLLTTIFGDNKKVNTIASRILADLNPLDVLRIFKNNQSCNQHFPKLSDALLEVIVREIGSDIFNVNSDSYSLNPFKGGFGDILTNYAGNISGEMVRKTDISEKIASKFCKLIK
jgi:hypothetical protein